MAKPFNFDVPIATERTVESIADVIKTNFATKDEVQNAAGGEEVAQLSAKVDEILEILNTIKSDYDTLFNTMEEVV